MQAGKKQQFMSQRAGRVNALCRPLPSGTDERRQVEGRLARKYGLGL